MTCLTKYFPLLCSIFTLFLYTLQGHEHPRSFSLLLAIAVAVQSRVCPDYEKFVLISKYTSFFCAKVSCPYIGLLSVILLSFFISCCPLHILKLNPRFFPQFFGSGFTLLVIIHIHTTYQTSFFIYSPLSLFSIHLTSILFVVFLFPLSSEFISVRIPFGLSCLHSGVKGISPSHFYFPLGTPGTSIISHPTPDSILTLVLSVPPSSSVPPAHLSPLPCLSPQPHLFL